MARTLPARRHHATELKQEGFRQTLADVRIDAAGVCSKQPTQEGVSGLCRADPHPHVHAVDAVLPNETPSCRTTTGLRSISLTSGRSSASRETRSSVSASPAVSTGGAAGRPTSSGATRTELIISSASTSVSGASRATLLPGTSVGSPPGPNTITGPNTGSCATPMCTSTPSASIGWTSTHRRVLRQRLRGERLQAALPRLPDQVLQQHAGDPAAVHVIGDGERDFRRGSFRCQFRAGSSVSS